MPRTERGGRAGPDRPLFVRFGRARKTLGYCLEPTLLVSHDHLLFNAVATVARGLNSTVARAAAGKASEYSWGGHFYLALVSSFPASRCPLRRIAVHSVVRRHNFMGDIPAEPFDFARHVTVFFRLRPTEWPSGPEDGRNGEAGTSRSRWATFRSISPSTWNSRVPPSADRLCVVGPNSQTSCRPWLLAGGVEVGG